MVLKDIMSISGEPGLFKYIAQGKNAIIVEHLETGKRTSAFSSARISSLDEISVFTDNEDMPLSKVFDSIFEKEEGGAAIDYKSDPEKLKAYLGEVIPDYDRDRVYVSDIKKIMHWYNILHSLNMLEKEEPEKVEAEDATAEDTIAKETKVKEASPKKGKAATGTDGKSTTKKTGGPAKK